MTTIRPATEADLTAILAIYNDAVSNTTAIWNDDVVDLENRIAWFRTRTGQGFPVFVAVEDQTVLGYASYGDFRPFQGYRLTVENSIYVDGRARGKGAGSALLAALIEHATAAGKHMMVAGITADNDVSLRLHARQGFIETARMPELGYKFGRFLDLVFLQRKLG
ncbi:GNAT family N-acetyltransferase [Kaistia dalseonensis]|uniref:Phosphinothricin acetyltransferase n=1 Tax=Kaistia dalseonensis TaxID=410840 RepID=A0ABU0H9U4_9HYPH|nr:GNAT family N-acetyltransferase [Kaistia dalseonensis]MCX5496466.1 GNAT family N-acetyltransferase [Kaistia dalseonensis]MDQ0439088.1 phosphinothricin acetyltransferase [Kaistia dalseonensis]